jgi:hypothetical protein
VEPEGLEAPPTRQGATGSVPWEKEERRAVGEREGRASAPVLREPPEVAGAVGEDSTSSTRER